MEDDQQQFDKDDYTGLDGQNGENFEHHESIEHSVEDGGDQAMETGGDNTEEISEDDRKIFVGGLSWETTSKDLKDFFEKYGEVTSCTLKTDLETRQSRGFGFIVFKDVDTVKKVLDVKEHILHRRRVDPKPANPREGIKKIFVGKLDPTVPEEDVKSYFNTFGAVKKIDLPVDKTKDPPQRRAFCFVEFESDTAVRKILEQAYHKLGGQEVDVKKATPNNAPQGSFGTQSGRGSRGWVSSSGYGRGGRARGNNSGWSQAGSWNQGYGYGGYGGYAGYAQGGYLTPSYGGAYSGYGTYGSDYYGYGQGWGGYDQTYAYGTYDGYDYGDWGYGQDDGGSSYGKTQKRGGHGGYHPYNR